MARYKVDEKVFTTMESKIPTVDEILKRVREKGTANVTSQVTVVGSTLRTIRGRKKNMYKIRFDDGTERIAFPRNLGKIKK